jgi:hypothetical protein
VDLDNKDFVQVGTHQRMGIQIVPLQDLMDLEPKRLDLNLLKNDDPNDERNKKSRGVLTVELLYKGFKEVNLMQCLVVIRNTNTPPRLSGRFLRSKTTVLKKIKEPVLLCIITVLNKKTK